MDVVSEALFLYLGEGMSGRACGLYSVPQQRRFRALFGVDPKICCEIWSRLPRRLLNTADPTHLLWSLLFLKTYANEDVLCVITQSDHKTLRKWVWCIISEISSLAIVRFMFNAFSSLSDSFDRSIGRIDYMQE